MVKILDQLQQSAVVFFIAAGQNIVLGDVIGALQKYLFSVDTHAEIGAVFIGRIVDLHFPNANAVIVLLCFAVIGLDHKGQVIQVGLSEANGIPAFGIVQHKRHLAAFHQGQLRLQKSTVRIHKKGYFQLALGMANHLHLHIHPHTAILHKGALVAEGIHIAQVGR